MPKAESADSRSNAVCDTTIGWRFANQLIEHPRDTPLEALALLKGVVRPEGTVRAGNASGVNDGAIALVPAGLTLAHMNVIAPNEAFAAQGLAVLRHPGSAGAMRCARCASVSARASP